MILLEPKRIFACVADCGCEQGCKKCHTALVKAQAKKILIELQAIYKDGGMFHNKMGEFIKELKDEVPNNLC